MWNASAPNWYYYGNSFAQHPQNQIYMPEPGSSMPTTFSTYMPHFYGQQPRQSRNEMGNVQQEQLQRQPQGQGSGSGQGQIWYQTQQPQQNYNYWCAMQQPQSFYQNLSMVRNFIVQL